MPMIYPFHPLQPVRRLQGHSGPWHALRESEPCYNGPAGDAHDSGLPSAESLEVISNLCLMDDEFMTAVFEDIPSAELLLRIILNRNDMTIQSVKCQNWMQNLQGRSVRLDILAKDTLGCMHNVEVQRADAGAGARRARYHSSLIDANITDPGTRYQNLRENYVIFITENDVLRAGLPIYHIDRTIKETGENFNDGAHIIYVNSQIRDETALGRLMHDFWCKNHEDMYYHELADRVRYFKTDEEGVISMSKIMEEYANKAAEAAARKANRDRSIQIAQMMIDNNEPDDKIARYTGLTLREILELRNGQPA